MKKYLIISLMALITITGCSKQDEKQTVQAEKIEVTDVTEDVEGSIVDDDNINNLENNFQETLDKSEDKKEEPQEKLDIHYALLHGYPWKDIFLYNLGKSIDETNILRDQRLNHLDSMLVDAETAWVYPKEEIRYALYSNGDSYAYFVNTTNEWQDEKDVKLRYYELSMDTLFESVLDTDIPDEFTIDNIRGIMGDPVNVLGEDQDILLYELDSAYLILDWHLCEFEIYIVAKEDCSVVLGDKYAKQLGYDSILEEDSGIWWGSDEDSTEVELKKKDKIQLCNRVYTIKDLDGYDFMVKSYELDNDGEYNISSATFNGDSAGLTSFSFRQFPEYNRFMDPFYNDYFDEYIDLEYIKVIHDDNKCTVYKANDTSMVSNAVSVYIKDFDTIVVITDCENTVPDNECIEKAKEIVSYFDKNVKVKIVD